MTSKFNVNIKVRKDKRALSYTKKVYLVIRQREGRRGLGRGGGEGVG